MADEPLLTAYESLIQALETNFLGQTAPINTAGKEPNGHLRLGDCTVRKYEDHDSSLLVCQAEYASGSLWWHQAGDNTADVLCMLGADPAKAAQFDHLKIVDMSPLDVIQIFALNEPAHWLYVTFGFSDLYATEGDSDVDSGFGMELTLRLPRAQDETTPPTWAPLILADLARHIFVSKKALRYGDFIDFGGPIFPKTPTKIEGVAIGFDPILEAMETLSGYVDVFSLTGLTRDELDLSRKMNTSLPLESAFSKIYGDNYLALFDYERNSMLIEEPDVVASCILVHADVWAKNNKWKSLERMLVGSIDFMREQGGPLYGHVLNHLFDCAKQNGEVDKALEYGQALTDLFMQHGQNELAVDSLETMADLCRAHENQEAANTLQARAGKLKQALGQQP